jgi:DNA-binding MarR family transcriptional regulator
VGKGFRGEEGHIGYLLQQAAITFRAAADSRLRDFGLSLSLYSVITVLTREPGASASDLARMCKQSPQSMNGVLDTLESQNLVARQDHPVHRRVRQVFLTEKGTQLVEQTRPLVDDLENAVEDGYTQIELATVRRWLVASAVRLSEPQRSSGTNPAPGRTSVEPSQSTSDTPATNWWAQYVPAVVSCRFDRSVRCACVGCRSPGGAGAARSFRCRGWR